MNMVELAHRLRKIRTDRGLTLEQVASEAGLTRGWLSKVENFRVTPSLPALSSIAGALGATLSELFEGLDTQPPIVVVRSGQRRPMKRDEDVSLLSYEALAYTRPSREMDPFVLTVPRADDRPLLTHAGEEFLFVLQGTVKLEYNGSTEQLDEGDSAYFDGEHPHRLVCEHDTPAKVLVVYCRNTEDTDTEHTALNGSPPAPVG